MNLRISYRTGEIRGGIMEKVIDFEELFTYVKDARGSMHFAQILSSVAH